MLEVGAVVCWPRILEAGAGNRLLAEHLGVGAVRRSLAKPRMGVWLAEDLGGCVASAGILTDRNRLLAHAGSWRCRLLALKIASLALQIVCTQRIVETAAGARNSQTQANWTVGYRFVLFHGTLAMQEVAANAFSTR